MASEARDLTNLPRRLIQGCRPFRARIVLRVLLIGATLWLLFHTTAGGWSYPAVTVAAALLLLYQIYGLVHFVDRTNRDLARFLAAIRYADFSQTFVSGGLGSSFDELKTAFNEVLDAFRLARAEKEEQARYLQTVVQHIGVGLLVFDGGGRVSLINNAAKRLLGVPRLGNIADLDRVSPGLAAALKNSGPGAATWCAWRRSSSRCTPRCSARATASTPWWRFRTSVPTSTKRRRRPGRT